eukprot:365069-Chlamydomonas_euryale.AAC.4
MTRWDAGDSPVSSGERRRTAGASSPQRAAQGALVWGRSFSPLRSRRVQLTPATHVPATQQPACANRRVRNFVSAAVTAVTAAAAASASSALRRRNFVAGPGYFWRWLSGWFVQTQGGSQPLHARTAV